MRFIFNRMLPLFPSLSDYRDIKKGLRHIGIGLVVAMLLATIQDACAESIGIPRFLTIEQACDIALKDNPDVSIARLAVYSTRAAIDIAGAPPNPSLTVGISGVNPNAGVGAGNLRSKTVDSSVRIDQLFERGGKRSLRVQNAAALNDAAEHDMQETRRQLVVAVRQAFYDLLAAQYRVAISTENATFADTTLSAARKRERAGDMAPSDVSRLQVDGLRSQNDLTQTRGELARARSVLLQLLGHGAQSGEIIAKDEWPRADRTLGIDTEALLAQRADVRAAAARLEAARAASRLAIAARTRDINLGIQYDHYPSSVANTQGGGNTFAFAIQIPLFVRNQFDGEIHSAMLAADSAEQTLLKIRDAARNEVMRLLADQQSAAERLIRFDDQLLPAAKKSADATEFAFLHGAIAIMDVLDVRRTYRLTQLDALAARVEHAKVIASLVPAPAFSGTQ